jgi:hypothetical protein
LGGAADKRYSLGETMKSIARLVLPILGVVVIIFQLTHYRGLDSPIWGLLLGAGLIVSPFTAMGMFIFYILFVAIPLGLGILGGMLGKEMFGQGFGAIIGFIAGIFFGGKFVLSDAFDKLIEPLRTLSKEDDNPSLTLVRHISPFFALSAQ